MKCYRVVAQSERMKTGRPGEGTVENALRGTGCVCRAAGIDLDSPVDTLTRQAFDTALAAFVERGLTRVTAWSYICQLRAIFARWCQPYYRDAGWEIPPLELPTFRAKAPRYIRPCAEVLARVKPWYERQTGECWFAATMMLEFAMRNGDVLRLKKENFVERSAECGERGAKCEEGGAEEVQVGSKNHCGISGEGQARHQEVENHRVADEVPLASSVGTVCLPP